MSAQSTTAANTPAAAPPADGKALYLEMMGMMTGYILPCAIQTAGRLGIADALADEDATPLAALAKRINVTDQDGLARLLRYLIGKGIFELAASDGEELQYKNNTRSKFLRKEGAMSLWGLACHLFDTTPVWEHVPQWLARDEASAPCSPWGLHYGKEFFEFLEAKEGRAAEFNHCMAGVAMARNLAAAQIDPSIAAKPGDAVIDLGGAQGTLLDFTLKGRPEARGVLFDLPHVVDDAKKARTAEGKGDTVEYVGGDFFDAATVPKGGSLYLLAKILHDWGDDDANKILKSVQEAMPADGTVVVIDLVLSNLADGVHATSNETWLDLQMMTVTVGGRERTRGEFEALFSAVGLRLDRIEKPGPGPDCLIYASKA